MFLRNRFTRFLVSAAAGLTVFVAGAAGSPPLRAEEAAADSKAADEKIDEVDQRVRILERKAELKAEADAEGQKTAGLVGAGKDGFFLKSADGSFILKIRGYLQTDGRAFSSDQVKPVVDTFLIRRARPIVEVTVGKIFDFRIMTDFGEGKTVLQDAYMDARFSPKASLRTGKFKAPVGLERLQSATDNFFVERALPTNLVPNRDIGLELWGGFVDGAISYAVGVFNGVADGGSADADINSTKEVAARVFVLPFKKSGGWAQGLGFGVAGSAGDNDGTLSTPGLSSYKTTGQQTFFSFLNDGKAPGTVLANGSHKRLAPQAYLFVGRFGLLAEWVRSTQKVILGTNRDEIAAKSWQATATFLLTSDKASVKGVGPKHPFDATPRGPGAIELVARAGALSVDEDAFPLFANPTASAQSAREVGAGVNWYLTRNVKFMLDGVRTRFGGGAATGDREDERVLFSRVQISF